MQAGVQGAGARGWRADGRAGRAGAGRGRRRALQVAGARRRWGGRRAAGRAGARQGERARGRASERAAGRAGVRLGARCARGTAGRQHGRAAYAHRLGQLGARAPGLVFSLVFRLGIFPESLNEHCSL